MLLRLKYEVTLTHINLYLNAKSLHHLANRAKVIHDSDSLSYNLNLLHETFLNNRSKHNVKTVGFLLRKLSIFFQSIICILAPAMSGIYGILSLCTQPAANHLCLLHGDAPLAWITSPHSLSLTDPNPNSSVHFPPLPSIGTRKISQAQTCQQSHVQPFKSPRSHYGSV